MGIYGHRFDDLIEQNTITESGYISDIPKYIKQLVNAYKKRKKDVKSVAKYETKIDGKREKWERLKKEFDNLPQDKKKEIIDLYNKEVAKFEQLATKELKKIAKDPEIRAQVMKSIKKDYEKGYIDSDKFPKLVNKVKDEGGYWPIVDGGQDEALCCLPIVDALAKRLEELTGYYVGTGDGDEGCIYPNIDNIYDFYAEYKKKEK